jgi:hypothetical protein
MLWLFDPQPFLRHLSEVDRLREAVTDEGRDKLQRIRQARDEIFKSIQKYQAIRETIKNVTVRAPSKKHNKCKRNLKISFAFKIIFSKQFVSLWFE